MLSKYASRFITWYMGLPAPIRKAVTDFLETSVAAVIALNLAFPGSTNDLWGEAAVVGAALGAALVAAIRRQIWPVIMAFFQAASGQSTT